jgi:hypothetical protein
VQKTIVQPLDLFLHRLTASGTGQAGPAVAPIYWRELSPIDVFGMSCLKLSGPHSAGDAVLESDARQSGGSPRGCIGCKN